MKENSLLTRISITTLMCLIAASPTSASVWGSVTNFAEDAQDAALYGAYSSYMYWVDSGAYIRSVRLPANLQRLLDPYYDYNLANVKISYTSRFSSLAMTDCKHIYFGERAIVNKLKRGEKLTNREFHWMAHELTHVGQCVKIGGRKKYALRWFGEVGDNAITQIGRGKFTAILNNILDAQKLARYDNEMAMEVHADRHADEVTTAAFARQ